MPNQVKSCVKMSSYGMLFYLKMHKKSTVPRKFGRIKRCFELSDAEFLSVSIVKDYLYYAGPPESRTFETLVHCVFGKVENPKDK